MFVLGNALQAITRLVDMVATIYTFILIGYVIISWVRADPFNPLVRFVIAATDPVLARIRRVVPSMFGIDFSALIALVIIQIGIQGFVVTQLRHWALQLMTR
jgi:YggT family protein